MANVVFDHRGPLVVWPFGAKLLEWIFSQKRGTLGHITKQVYVLRNG